jgi:hypothetical protein
MTGKISTGGDIDAYCTKCRLNLEHVVVAMVGGAVVKVKCKTCGGTHRFKDMPSVRQKSSGKEGKGSKSFVAPRACWETAVETADGPELPYEMASSYRAGDLIVHRVFGKGVVQKTSFKKCSVLFSDKERVLVTSNT